MSRIAAPIAASKLCLGRDAAKVFRNGSRRMRSRTKAGGGCRTDRNTGLENKRAADLFRSTALQFALPLVVRHGGERFNRFDGDQLVTQHRGGLQKAALQESIDGLVAHAQHTCSLLNRYKNGFNLAFLIDIHSPVRIAGSSFVPSYGGGEAPGSSVSSRLASDFVQGIFGSVCRRGRAASHEGKCAPDGCL